jgi:hypothetical protein
MDTTGEHHVKQVNLAKKVKGYMFSLSCGK